MTQNRCQMDILPGTEEMEPWDQPALVELERSINN